MTFATACVILRHTTKPRAPSQCQTAKQADVPVELVRRLEAGDLDPSPALCESLLHTLASTPRDKAVVLLTLKAIGVQWQ